jgi:hypothetical protein
VEWTCTLLWLAHWVRCTRRCTEAPKFCCCRSAAGLLTVICSGVDVYTAVAGAVGVIHGLLHTGA